MENAIAVHMVDSLEHLVHVILDSLFGQIVPSALDGFIHVHVHQFKDERKPASRLIAATKK